MATVTKGQKYKEFQKYFVTKNRNIKNSKNTIRKKKTINPVEKWTEDLKDNLQKKKSK